MKLSALALAGLAAVAVTASSGALVSAHGVAHKKVAGGSFLKIEAAKKTIVFTALAGDGTANGGLDFDNAANGQLTLTVPLHWTVDVVFKNVGGLPHSVLFETWNTSLSNANPTPAFKGASSPDPVSGTPPGSGANFHFVAAKVGKYRMVCAFPGHASLGMWDTMIVSKTAKTASLKG